MGWVRGYGNYRSDEQRESPVFIFSVPFSSRCVFVVVFFWGYFGVGSGTHYMYSRGDDDEIIKIL